jgi:hypothetical protein
MRRWLNPRRIIDNVRRVRDIKRGGGPRKIHVRRVSPPKGIVAPTSEVLLDVENRDGTMTPVETILPVPWPVKWTWQIGRALHIPVLRSLDPALLENRAVPVPGVPGLSS